MIARAVHGRTRPPASVSAAAFVSSFDRFAVSPLLVLLATDLGTSLAQATTVASSYFLAYGLCQPLWGCCPTDTGECGSCGPRFWPEP